MALEEFWTGVWMASGFMVPHAAVDAPRLEPARIEEHLRNSPYWLTPDSVRGFEGLGEFDFLRDEEREKLGRGVEEFLVVANRVTWKDSPSEDQLAGAIEGFRDVLEVVRPDQYADLEAFVLGKKIERAAEAELPGWARELVFESGVDFDGYPNITIWAEVEDEAFDGPDGRSNCNRVRELLWRTTRRVTLERWPHVHFRGVSEQRPVTSAAGR